MTYQIKIKERFSEFTPSDKKIANFILNNPKAITTSSSMKLAELIDTSQSAIIRFVQKIGYKSYTDLKVDIAKSKQNDDKLVESEVIAANDSVSEIIKKSKQNVISSIEKTYALLDEKDIIKVIELIKNSENVYLAGIGSSGLICEDFLYKLQRAGKKVFYERDGHTNITLISNIRENDLLICISYTGLTKEILLASEYAKEKNAKIVSITKFTKGRLSSFSDVILPIPEIEKKMRFGAISSRFSSQIITDILFYGYISDNVLDVIEKLKISKALTDKLRN